MATARSMRKSSSAPSPRRPRSATLKGPRANRPRAASAESASKSELVKTAQTAAKKRPEGKPAAQLFKRMDRNGDGKVTADEVPEERRPMIERLIERADRDGDQALSLQEFTAAMDKRRPNAGAPPAGSPVAKRPFQAVGGKGRLPGLFGAIDADGDGQLSSDEIAAAPAVIRKLDVNGDGKVSLDEIMEHAARAGGDN